MNEIHQFWEDMAKEHGAADTATAPDSAYREHEIRSIIPHIKGPNILDVGCGNGFSTVQFMKACPEGWSFTGIDYSQEMINRAKEVEADNLHYAVANVLNLPSPAKTGILYDTVISERCLINLETWDEQMLAIRNMADQMMGYGRMIIVENFTDGLRNLNNLRGLFGLHEIKVRWHNHYLNKLQFEAFCSYHFNIVHRENIGNLYYIISRVVYAALAKQDGKEPEYKNPINFIAAKLPTVGELNFSPNMLYVLEKK